MTARYSLFINGDTAAAADGRTESIVAPASEDPIADVPVGSAEDVERAVNAAAAAFESWGATTPGERSVALLKLADRIESHADELAAIESANVGKPMWLAKSEIPFV